MGRDVDQGQQGGQGIADRVRFGGPGLVFGRGCFQGDQFHATGELPGGQVVGDALPGQIDLDRGVMRPSIFQ